MGYTKILSTASYVPEVRRTNSDLEKLLGTDLDNGGTTDQWIIEHVGIKERRITLPYETHKYMALEACKRVMKKSDVIQDKIVGPEQISIILAGNTHESATIPCRASYMAQVPAFDVITTELAAVEEACKAQFGSYSIYEEQGLVAGSCNGQAKVYHYKKEGLSQKIAKEFGINAYKSFDLTTGCASFNFGLALADALIKKEPRYIIVAAVDKMLDVTNPTDRSTVILFGELASAALLGPSEEPGFTMHRLQTDGSKRDLIAVKQSNGWDRPYLWQEGRAVYRWAVRKIIELTKLFIENSSARRILVPHQANPRMIYEASENPIFQEIAKTIVTGDLFGNCSTVSTAHALDQTLTQRTAEPGDYIGVAGFGAGLSSALNSYRVV